MVEKIDLRKKWKYLYHPSARQPELVTVPPFQYLMIDGSGNPNNSEQYQQAVPALYSLAYAIKFRVRNEQGIDYSVMPLEGLWWGTPQNQHTFTDEDKEKWFWTAMILQPEWVTEVLFQNTLLDIKTKKNLPGLEKIRFEQLDEGLCVQMMHTGPYDQEGPTSEAMHQFTEQAGYKLRGHHHEIYLKDPNRTAPDKLMTILRHPIQKNG